MDQVVLLTQSIENFFEAKKKVDAVFFNLTATYDILATWSYLQAAEAFAGKTHGQNDYGAWLLSYLASIRTICLP